ncbi:NAD(P)H-dependent oxidoreductase [Agrobacterium rubi]|uniref:Flavodoxin-like fold domain-containing protein n=1 Tax=Agrobacterium rubi TR3 = NBRC 13261 TaxID=1368415 RepID=A0A081CY14_9HYPH|nr:NAD(P)H-dependent oxidoreductase [Agrobacterium rubi]MBP1881382.1 NAD(P)H dehydrogenase (quinone) [Agrobacterium rubi]MCL6655023.1 NAD(P)H dehydrogenase [Agrobacterium rubi]NTF06942.1 NAD(P)H-dependent oxidoreductase [Agrobacterium rubi]NTF19184.1 NAD(P)H-dependent oxidoreductase [Agrobacterium rubi]NTF26147.1 NAD(P)H-dependent oxidoreductase [Agrobacterium rubi]
MHAVIVTSHPNPSSLTNAIAARIAEGITKSPGGHSHEFAHLAAEAFDPRFTQHDIALMLGQATPIADVAAEHTRLDRADALIIVYPVYWWSMPAQLKGWIDRVFTNGWAYADNGDGKIIKKLDRLNVHLIAIGGADMRTYARHGYFGAMRTQIDHGIFGYCGAKVVTSELMVPDQANDFAHHLDTAYNLGTKIFPA